MKGPIITDYNVAHPDSCDGAIYRVKEQLTIASDDLIRFRSSTKKANTIEMNVNDGIVSATTMNASSAITTTCNINTNEKLLEKGQPLIPKGTIILWSGSANAIPNGWTLCDGNNGTPNLKDRFVIGCGGSYKVNKLVGTKSVKLGLNHVPTHPIIYGMYRF
jgi:hypothetical protein